jgi:hypothetical protein
VLSCVLKHSIDHRPDQRQSTDRLPVRLLSHSQSYPLCLEPQLKDTEKQTTVFLAELGIFPSFPRKPDATLAKGGSRRQQFGLQFLVRSGARWPLRNDLISRGFTLRRSAKTFALYPCRVSLGYTLNQAYRLSLRVPDSRLSRTQIALETFYDVLRVPRALLLV